MSKSWLDGMVLQHFETKDESINAFEVEHKRWELLYSIGNYEIENYAYIIETNYDLFYVDTYHNKVIRYPHQLEIHVRLTGILQYNWLYCTSDWDFRYE